ncbi:MAG: FixH family protein [Gallionella sp.]|nr:FixH family protein [Gallionella sp.]MDD4958783.1 FixH family protein [Gallionella sp.]
MISQSNKKGWRNPWLFGLLGLVLSGVAINVVFVLNSLDKGRSTLVDEEYNTRNHKTDAVFLKEIEAQSILAWKTTIKQPKFVPLNVPQPYEIAVADLKGVPVSGQMEVMAYRASDAAKDFKVAFKETSPGHYQGFMNFALKGYWKLRIRVVRDKDVFVTESEKFSVRDVAAQNALGWKLQVKQPTEAVHAMKPSTFEVSANDAQGLPVSGKMTVVANYRSSDVSQEFTVPFNEVSAGKYQGLVKFPIKGDWELSIRIIRDKDVFEIDSDKFIVAD